MYFASGWTDRWTNDIATALAELAIENGTFYPLYWLFGKIMPQGEVSKEGSETLKEMLAVEGLDLGLRFLLFLFALNWPGMKAYISGFGSMALDIAFLFFLSRSHQLLEIIRQRRRTPRFTSLGLTQPFAAL